VNPWLILTGLVLAVAVVLVARAVRPGSGQRRSLAVVLPPVEALAKFEAHCLTEQRPTLHVRFGGGTTQCLECRNPSGGWTS
jgi:hypothetical protein